MQHKKLWLILPLLLLTLLPLASAQAIPTPTASPLDSTTLFWFLVVLWVTTLIFSALKIEIAIAHLGMTFVLAAWVGTNGFSNTADLTMVTVSVILIFWGIIYMIICMRSWQQIAGGK